MDKHDYARHLGECCVESGLEADFSLFCQGTDDGDDGTFICCSFQDLFVMYDNGH